MKFLKNIIRVLCVVGVLALCYGGIFCALNMSFWMENGTNDCEILFMVGFFTIIIGVLGGMILFIWLMQLFISFMKWVWSK